MHENYKYEPLTDEEKDSVKDKIFRHIQGSSYHYKNSRTFWSGKWRLSSIAAMIVSGIPLAIYLFAGSVTDSKTLLFAAVTGAREKKEITMSDGSVVILNGGSTLKYNSHYAEGQREVYLQGNAFFKVKKTATHQPFVVYANGMEITVLGTQFNVNARSKKMEVVLTTGKVKVDMEDRKNSPVYLLPGEKITLDTLTQQLNKSQVDIGLYGAWTRGEWNFQQTSLEQVSELLEEYYGVKTIFRNEAHRRLTMNAVIPVTNLETLVPVIAKTLQIDINLVTNQLIIQ